MIIIIHNYESHSSLSKEFECKSSIEIGKTFLLTFMKREKMLFL